MIHCRPWTACHHTPPPVTGARRVKAGLADITQHHVDVVDVRREREARALVAVLPFECAVFLLHPTPPERIRAEPPPAIAERLVALLKRLGVA